MIVSECALRRLTITATIVLATTFALSAEERQISVYKGMKAFVSSAPSWCGETVNVTIRSDSGADFSGDKRDLQRMLGGLRAILGEECPKVGKIRIVGFAGGAETYRGIATSDTDWVLVDTATKPVSPSAPAAQPSATSATNPSTSASTPSAVPALVENTTVPELRGTIPPGAEPLIKVAMAFLDAIDRKDDTTIESMHIVFLHLKPGDKEHDRWRTMYKEGNQKRAEKRWQRGRLTNPRVVEVSKDERHHPDAGKVIIEYDAEFETHAAGGVIKTSLCWVNVGPDPTGTLKVENWETSY